MRMFHFAGRNAKEILFIAAQIRIFSQKISQSAIKTGQNRKIFPKGAQKENIVTACKYRFNTGIGGQTGVDCCLQCLADPMAAVICGNIPEESA